MRKNKLIPILLSIGFAMAGLATPYLTFAKDYVIMDLGTLGGYSYAFDINESCQVVGYSSTASSVKAFLWDIKEGMQELESLDDGWGNAFGINNSGQIVGSSAYRIVLWDNGTVKVIDSNSGRANAVNDFGQVVGWTTGFGDNSHPFYWDSIDGMQDLGLFGGNMGEACAISEFGEVVGWSDVPGGADRAFLWDRISGMQNLGTLGGNHSSAHDINDLGQVVGFSTTNGSSKIHAFIWEDGVMTDLGTLGGDHSWAEGINNFGQVVGISSDSSGYLRPFLWDRGIMQNLLDLIKNAHSFDFIYPQEINDSGQIVGYGHANGQSHAFFMAPRFKEYISNIGSCPDWACRLGFEDKTPTWGTLGTKTILEFDSGETLQIKCAGCVQFQLLYTRPGDVTHVVGSCPYNDGCNSGEFWHIADNDNNDKPDALVKTRWISRDYGEPDKPDWWLDDAGDDYLDWAVSELDAVANNLVKTAIKYTYRVGPPVYCNVTPNPEGNEVGRVNVDPPLGPETDAFFDRILENLQSLPPSEPMVGDMLPPCDFDGDGDCDSADEQIVDAAVGACQGDSAYHPVMDYNADGCITASDKEGLFSTRHVLDVPIDIKPGSYPNSINLKARGVVAVAILTTNDFDASTVNQDAVLFAGATLVHCTMEDVNNDGRMDLLCHFNIQDLNLGKDSSEAILNGITNDGKYIWGTDTVRIVPERK